MSDRIVILNKGRMEQIGSPLNLYDRAANLFVATFIGSPAMNIFRGEIEQGDGAARVRIGTTRLRLPSRLAIADNVSVMVGIRPEHFELADSTTGESLDFALDLIEPTGAETHLYGQAADQVVTVTLRDRLALSAPARLSLVARPEHIHIFREKDGARVGSLEP